MKQVFTIFIILIIFACANKQWTEHEEILLEDTPSEYRQGYIDGCASGENIAGSYITKYKQSNEYLNDGIYKRAWDVGYKYCKAQLGDNQGLEHVLRY